MKRLFLILLFSVSLTSFGQVWLVKNITYQNQSYLLYPKYQESGRYLMVNDLKWVWKQFKRGDYSTNRFPKDGLWIQFFAQDSSKVARIFEVKDSSLTGVYEEYSLNGIAQIKGNLKDAHYFGKWTYYTSYGDIWKEEEYGLPDGFQDTYYSRKVGTAKTWYSSGRLKSIEYYNGQGKRTNTWIDYFESGQIKLLRKYVDGLLDSVFTEYADNGEILHQERYIKEELQDTMITVYYDNGKIRSQGNMYGSVQKGLWSFYYSTGQMMCTGYYEPYTTTLCSSAFPREFTFTTQVDNWIYFYENGIKKAEGQFKAIEYFTSRGSVMIPLETGEWTYYYSTGKIMAKGLYERNPKSRRDKGFKQGDRNAKKIGKWEYYDENGLIAKFTDLIKTIQDNMRKVNSEPVE